MRRRRRRLGAQPRQCGRTSRKGDNFGVWPMMKVLLKTLAAGVASLFLLAVAACGDVKDENWARSFFDRNEKTLVKITELVSKCDGKGTMSIYPDARTIGSPVNCPNKNEIAELLKTLGILWINVSGNLPYGGQGPFATMFVLSSYGLLTSGSGSAIYYEPALETNPFGDSIALKGIPGHWFYRRT